MSQNIMYLHGVHFCMSRTMSRELGLASRFDNSLLVDEGDVQLEDGCKIIEREDLNPYNRNNSENDNDSSDNSSAQEMDPSLWGSLSEDMEDRILAMLPFEAFARMRNVCKRWNNSLKSSIFLSTYSSIQSDRQQACFLMFDAKDWSSCWLYNPVTNHWHMFPFDFKSSEAKFPCTAGGGLLCFCGVSSYPNLYICNPLTRQWKTIPQLSYNRFPNLIGMVVDKASSSYKIVVAGDYHGQNARSTEVFDSKRDCWITMEGDVPLINLTPRNCYCLNSIFWLTGDPYGLMSLNLEQGKWKVIQAPMPLFLTSPHLVGCHDRLLMIGGLKKHLAPKSIRIWHLDLASLVWEEIKKMPDVLCKRLLRDSLTGDFMCIGQNNIICLTSYKCSQALMYDISRNIWQWLPPCPFLSVVDIYHLHIGLPFTPSWDTIVE